MSLTRVSADLSRASSDDRMIAKRDFVKATPALVEFSRYRDAKWRNVFDVSKYFPYHHHLHPYKGLFW
jgi:hypothetical protein